MFNSDIFERSVQDPCSLACDESDSEDLLDNNNISINNNDDYSSMQNLSIRPRKSFRTNSSTLIYHLSRQNSKDFDYNNYSSSSNNNNNINNLSKVISNSNNNLSKVISNNNLSKVISNSNNSLSKVLTNSNNNNDIQTSSDTCSAIPTHLYSLEKYIDSHLLDPFTNTTNSNSSISNEEEDNFVDANDDNLSPSSSITNTNKTPYIHSKLFEKEFNTNNNLDIDYLANRTPSPDRNNPRQSMIKLSLSKSFG